MRWVQTNISSIYYFTEIPIILKQHIPSDWITNEPRKPWGDVLRTLSAHGYSKLWRTSLSMNKPTTWCKSGRVSLVSPGCLYKTQPERALAQVCHTRIDALSPDKYQFHLLLQTDGQTENTICRAAWSQLKSSGNPFSAKYLATENYARNTKMYRGQETHPTRVNARYEMNWANSFFKKYRKPCRLQTDGRTDRRTDIGVSPVYPHSTFGGAGV